MQKFRINIFWLKDKIRSLSLSALPNPISNYKNRLRNKNSLLYQQANDYLAVIQHATQEIQMQSGYIAGNSTLAMAYALDHARENFVAVATEAVRSAGTFYSVTHAVVNLGQGTIDTFKGDKIGGTISFVAGTFDLIGAAYINSPLPGKTIVYPVTCGIGEGLRRVRNNWVPPFPGGKNKIKID
jgi:hypothetical protein